MTQSNGEQKFSSLSDFNIIRINCTYIFEIYDFDLAENAV